jgi:endoglucanase
MRKLRFVFWAVIFTIATACQNDEPIKSADDTSTDELGLTGSAAGRGKPVSGYPNYNTSPQPPDQTGMTSTAVQLAANIRLGWNLGNTLEALGGETYWGNPMASQAMIDKVKASGFNAIRIPVQWHEYADARTGKIQDAWLARVKQVVQYCVNDGLYVIVNQHHNGWLQDHVNTRDQASVNAQQKAYWEQIATTLRDFDEHVMFASANEPPVEDATQMSVLLSYHQTFINAVRSTGGKNTYRVLVVQGPSTDIDRTTNLMNTLPTDPTPNKMMAEIHYYDPSQFTLITADATWGNMFYYWGNGYHSTTDPSRNATWGEEAHVIGQFQKMKTKFVDQGIPVVMGEYGAIRRTTALTGDALTLHLASRAYWNKFVTQQARAHGLLPFYWDEGSITNHGFGIFDRWNVSVYDQQVLDALNQGAQ